MIEKFLERFPEFQNTEEKLVKIALYESKIELNPNTWGELFEIALLFLAADKLARSPMGEPVRLEGQANKTTYALEFERLCRSIFVGARVV